MLLGALALTLLMLVLGTVITVGREGLLPADGGWVGLLDRAASVVQLAAWCVVAVSYAVRTRVGKPAR